MKEKCGGADHMTSHPFRCETCEYFAQPNNKSKKYKSFKGYCRIGQERSHSEYFPIYDSDWGFSELFGCASHSDASKAEQRITDVIEELENSIKIGSEIRLDKLIKKLRGELV